MRGLGCECAEDDGFKWVDVDGFKWVGMDGFKWVAVDGFKWVGLDGFTTVLSLGWVVLKYTTQSMLTMVPTRAVPYFQPSPKKASKDKPKPHP